ncbi:hypothetical protein ACFQ0G_32885 [Streptomyces chiangmaiensis]
MVTSEALSSPGRGFGAVRSASGRGRMPWGPESADAGAPWLQARLPTWMTALDRFTPLKVLGLGLLLSAVNAKNAP